VTSTNNVPIVVERAMYWPGTFFELTRAHVGRHDRDRAALGDRGVATAIPHQTFVLLANTDNPAGTGGAPHHVAIRVQREPARVVNLPANSRDDGRRSPACRRARLSS
jgi:hypothetical protein